MSDLKPRKRISRADWLERALKVLEKDGADEVKIDRLARELKVARSGFYWHFEDRQALIRAMIEYWGDEFTAVVTSNRSILSGNPRQRLMGTMKMIVKNDLTRYEIPMRAFAEKDPVARKLVDRIYRRRLEFTRTAFSDMGFRGDELEMRTHLFVCYHAWEGPMFRNLSKADRTKWIRKRLDLLCQPTKKSL